MPLPRHAGLCIIRAMLDVSPRDDTPSDAGVARRRKTRAWIILAIFLGPLVVPVFHRGTLIDHLPAPWFAIGIALGGLAGVAMDVLIVRTKGANDASADEGKSATNDLKLAGALLMLPALGCMLGTYYARFVFEEAAFVNYTPKIVRISAGVASTATGRGGPRAYVLPYQGARELEVDITNALYAQLEPIRQPGRDCLALDIEIGRGGVKRTMLPAYFDSSFGTDHWQQCADYQGSEEAPPSS